MNASLDRLELFYGDASESVARVYARLDLPSGTGADLRLSGTLVGPYCPYAQTLPSTILFGARGPGASLLAEAVVPDPCFWSPDLPFTYHANVELLQGGRRVASLKRCVGLRRLAVRGSNFMFDGKRWVLRGVQTDSTTTAELSQWRDVSAAMLVQEPDEQLCASASEAGVLLVADLSQGISDVISRLQGLARWPAVGMAILPPLAEGFDLRKRVPNLLLVQNLVAGATLQAWAHAVIVEASEFTGSSHSGAMADGRPAMVRRPLITSANLRQARDACDALQRDVADWQHLAGYIV